jgi:glutathione peroxidase
MLDRAGRLSFLVWAFVSVAFPAWSDEMTMQATATNGAQASTNAPAAAVAPAATAGNADSLYALTVNAQDGKPIDLHQYMGQVALVVNTASKSGYGDQFAGLEKLYEAYKDKGFVVLAFPCDDFGHLESGTPQDVAGRYVSFKLSYPVFATVKVRGDGQSPVYHFLTTGHSMPTWNFHKYLVDKTGKVIAEFTSQTKPDNKDLLAAIDAALK